MTCKIRILLGDYAGGYDIDFQGTTQNGNDLANQMERMFVDNMALMFVEKMAFYPYRRRQMLHLLTTGMAYTMEPKP